MSIEILPNVPDLQQRKSQTETYQSFHELYSGRELEKKGFSLMLSRVLQVDEIDDSMHVIVAKREIPGERILPTLYTRRGNLVRYSHAEVKVAVTNGETIAEYDTTSVYGIYRAVGGRMHPRRKLSGEQMNLNFLSPEGAHIGRAEFDRHTGDGNFFFGNRIMGKILGAAESDHLRQVALTPDISTPIQGTEAS